MAERKPIAPKQPPYKWVAGLSLALAASTALQGGLEGGVGAYFVYVLVGTALIACAVAFTHYAARDHE
jgi:hypothetical protein